MKVLMTGGGTGGHINPALAIAATIKEHDKDAQIAFVGTKKGMENTLVPREGYELYHIEIQGLRRSLSFQNIKTLYLTLTSPSKAKKLLKKEKPDLVVGTGGYVCYPLIKAASSMGIPTALHESNAQPGVAVKLLSGCVDVIFTNFEVTSSLLKEKYRDKIVNVGNPYRKGSVVYTKEQARAELGIEGKYRHSVLICGGSLGAVALNNCVTEYIKKYAANNPDTLITHASGARNYEQVKQKYAEYGIDKLGNVQLLDYIYDMPRRMAAADVVVCRCGAMTLSELALMGKPSVLIPSPNVTDNHQYKNGKVLSDAGAAVLIEEKDLDADILNEKISEILSSREKQSQMRQICKNFAHPEANELIYQKLCKIVRGRNNK